MTVTEIKNWVKEEQEVLVELARENGERVNKKEIKESILTTLEQDGKITTEQYNKMIKHYKLG